MTLCRILTWKTKVSKCGNSLVDGASGCSINDGCLQHRLSLAAHWQLKHTYQWWPNESMSKRGSTEEQVQLLVTFYVTRSVMKPQQFDTMCRYALLWGYLVCNLYTNQDCLLDKKHFHNDPSSLHLLARSIPLI